MNWFEQATAIIKQFDERQDVALTTRIMTHGSEALGLLREMIKHAPKTRHEKSSDEFFQWGEANHKYVVPADLWPWLEQAFEDGRKVASPILKGVGKINGDGWKDTTKVGEVIFVWNQPLPEQYSPGHRRVGNEIYAAGHDQYDFQPATVEEVQKHVNDLLNPPTPQGAIRRVLDALNHAADIGIWTKVEWINRLPLAMGSRWMVTSFRTRRLNADYDPEVEKAINDSGCSETKRSSDGKI